MMDAQELYERMKKVQEAKGYYFNRDRERTFELLEALLVNKERYGYMVAHADYFVTTATPTKISFVPAFTVCRTSMNLAVVTATSTFQQTGMRAKFHMNISPNADRWKK